MPNRRVAIRAGAIGAVVEIYELIEQINSRPALKTEQAWVTLHLTLETDLMFCYRASDIHLTDAKLVMDGSATRPSNGTRAAASNGYLAGRVER